MTLPFFDRPLHQYLVGLGLNAAVFLLLFLHPVSRPSLDLPKGEAVGHPWRQSDVDTYVGPAREFLATGTFARNGAPDMHRTVGYPLFLAGMMKLFGARWTWAAYAFQILLSALFYPAMTVIARVLFPEIRALPRVAFFVFLATGVVWSYVGQLLSDQFFTALLVVGLACGLLAVTRPQWVLWVLHIACLTWAAQVRPVLGPFFLVEACWLTEVAHRHGTLTRRAVRSLILLSTLLLLLAGNGPALRNYVHHGIFTPSDVLANSFSRYLAGSILRRAGQAEQFEVRHEAIKALEGREKLQAQVRFGLQAMADHPREATMCLTWNAVWNLFEPQWQNLLYSFRLSLLSTDLLGRFVRWRGGLWLAAPFALFYLVLYGAVGLHLVACLRQRRWLFLAGFAVLLLPLAFSFLNGQGSRMRLYAEGIFVLIALAELLPRVSRASALRPAPGALP